MFWTFSLLLTAGGGTLIAARRWWGWAILVFSEFLWAAYALSFHAHALFYMSIFWFFINLTNAIRTYRTRLQMVEE